MESALVIVSNVSVDMALDTGRAAAAPAFVPARPPQACVHLHARLVGLNQVEFQAFLGVQKPSWAVGPSAEVRVLAIVPIELSFFLRGAIPAQEELRELWRTTGLLLWDVCLCLLLGHPCHEIEKHLDMGRTMAHCASPVSAEAH